MRKVFFVAMLIGCLLATGCKGGDWTQCKLVVIRAADGDHYNDLWVYKGRYRIIEALLAHRDDD